MQSTRVTKHESNEVNGSLLIETAFEPGRGGAYWCYTVSAPGFGATLMFQSAPISEVGVNGLTNEALLAIVGHRLEGFQSGKYACEENQLALDAVNSALEALHSRTSRRQSEGVEGTSAPDAPAANETNPTGGKPVDADFDAGEA